MNPPPPIPLVPPIPKAGCCCVWGCPIKLNPPPDPVTEVWPNKFAGVVALREIPDPNAPGDVVPTGLFIEPKVPIPPPKLFDVLAALNGVVELPKPKFCPGDEVVPSFGCCPQFDKPLDTVAVA